MKEVKTVNELRKLVRSQRLGQEISQKDLAKDCGITNNTVLAFEHGTDNTGIISVIKMCNALGLKIYIQ